MRRIDDACGNITQHDASRPGQDASRYDRVNHIDDACGITATPMLESRTYKFVALLEGCSIR